MRTMASRPLLLPNRTHTFGSFTSPRSHIVASSQFRLKVTCHPFSWMPASRARLLKAARFNNLRHIILSTSAAKLNEEHLSGTQLKDKPARQLNVDAILVISEGICISIASVSCLASLTMHKSQDSRLVRSSVLEPIMPQKANLPVWQTFFLLAALIVNAILRARQRPSRGHSRDSPSNPGVADSNVEGRVRKLEEDIATAVTIIRGLSKQLEKLAVRFRVTRQTLRDPINETAELAQKTSESVNNLTAKNNALEKNFEEMHQVLLGMQENQTKQLELIVTLRKLVKDRPSNKVENSNKAGTSNLRAGLQQIGQERAAKHGNSTMQNKATEKRKGSLQRTSLETLQDQSSDMPSVQARMQSGNTPNKVTRDTHRVDFWHSTPVSSSSQLEEPSDGADKKNHSSSDGRPRAAFLD